MKVVAELGNDRFLLVLAQQPIVDQDARQPRADRLVEKGCRDGGVHAPRKPTNHPGLFPDSPSNRLHGFPGEIAQMPGARALADDRQEIVQQRSAQGGMRHLRVELQTVHGKLAMTDGSDGTGTRPRQRHEIPRNLRDLVSVAHPHIGLSGHSREQLGFPQDLTAGAAVFTSG